MNQKSFFSPSMAFFVFAFMILCAAIGIPIKKKPISPSQPAAKVESKVEIKGAAPAVTRISIGILPKGFYRVVGVVDEGPVSYTVASIDQNGGPIVRHIPVHRFVWDLLDKSTGNHVFATGEDDILNGTFAVGDELQVRSRGDIVTLNPK